MNYWKNILIFIIFYLEILEICAVCPNHCNNQGTCDIFGRCTCSKGYQGADCSEKICPFSNAWSDEAIGIDTAHQQVECSNRGICNRNEGKCICMSGFSGSACERLDCSKDCSKHGVCYSMKDFALRTRDINSKQFTYNTRWDSNKIQGCHCDYPYTGYDCSIQLCPSGDDPLTTSSQVNEIQLLKCSSIRGSFTLFYNGRSSTSIPYNANAKMITQALLSIPELTAVKVTFSQIHGTACQVKPNIISIEFTAEFGPQKPLVPYPDSVFLDSGGTILVSADGITSFTDVSLHAFTSVKGTKENALCSNRGICDLSVGVCNCFSTNGDTYDSSNGYGDVGSRGDCGYVSSSTLSTGVSTCPGIIQCSGHGVCDTETYQCYCSIGWFGGDCSQMQCPTGRSWFAYPTSDESAHLDYSICSNMGKCDSRRGKCVCRDGFYGEACEYMACGGGVGNSCSGHGRCMSMSQLALWANKNGDATDYIYGSDPNNFATWDYDRIHGCLCDKGYSGYDCSLTNCPTGDDPGTYKDHTEVQLLQCIANNGNFSLSFRQSITPLMSCNITATDMQAILNTLPTIKNANVYYIYDGIPPNGTLNYIKPSKLSQGDLTPIWGGFKHIKTGNTTAMDFEPFKYYPVDKSNDTINSRFCMTDGSQVAIISFESNQGDLPAIIPDISLLGDFVNADGKPGSGVINVYTDGQDILGLGSIKGTTETDICNNRGLCDTNTGICQCFYTWGSSDGRRQGGPGLTGDCGFRNEETTYLLS